MRMLEMLAAVAALAVVGVAAAQDKVIYHFDAGLAQATKGMRNVRNHLEVDSKAKIVVVAHAEGVDFLVEDLKAQGVSFEVCRITLRNRKREGNQFIPEVQYVPSGMARIAQLQQKEGYAYIKP